jgi:hypothetical protein
MDIPEPPEKCNWKKLREWLNLVREAVITAQPIAGQNISISEHPGQGTTINADNCDPCP